VDVVARPAAQQRALPGWLQERADEAGLRAEAQRLGWVDEEQPLTFDPREELPEHVGLLVACLGRERQHRVEIGGSDFDPTGQSPDLAQVFGEVTQDPQLVLQGDVADRLGTDPACPVTLAQQVLVEGDDGRLKGDRHCIEVALASLVGATPAVVGRQGQAGFGEEGRERAGQRIWRVVAVGEALHELLRAGSGRIGGEHRTEGAQDLRRPTRIVPCCDEDGELLPPGRHDRQPLRQRRRVAKGPIRVGEPTPVA